LGAYAAAFHAQVATANNDTNCLCAKLLH
jgi:hypothetical protein